MIFSVFHVFVYDYGIIRYQHLKEVFLFFLLARDIVLYTSQFW